MSRLRPVCAALGLVVLLVTACGTSAHGTGAPGAGSSPTASLPPGMRAPGQSAQADNGQVTATMYEYRQPVATNGPPAGPSASGWAAADVQVCVLSSSIFDVSVSRDPWQVRTQDGRVVSATLLSDNRFPQPSYPTEHRRLRPGECLRGWVVFPVPDTTSPTAVEYAPPGGQATAWTVH
jgi:hypothetical protein